MPEDQFVSLCFNPLEQLSTKAFNIHLLISFNTILPEYISQMLLLTS